MPDTAPTQDAPAAAAAPAASGIQSFMADFDAAVVETPDAAPNIPAKTDAKPEAKGAEKPAASKPVEKPVAAKPTDKPPEKPVVPPTDNVAQLRKRKDALEAYEKQAKSEISKLQLENKSLQERRIITPELEKEIETNKSEIQRLKSQIAESAWEHSDEFKSKYVEPWQRTLQSALSMVDQMTTPDRTEEGGEGSRKTTSADFQRVMAAPVGEQADMAQRIFGTNALRVLTQIDKLNDLKQQAEASVKTHHAEQGAKQKQFEEWQRTETQKYSTLRDDARKELAEKYPQFFAPDEADPEASDALAKGYEFVDRAAEKAHELSVDERAAYAEVIRARAAWFPRGHRELAKAKEKIASLEQELTAFRGSDPGAEKEKGRAVEKKTDDLGTGIEGLTAAFDR